MSNRKYRVQIGERKYSPEFQSAPEYAKGWKSALQKGHGHATAYCHCPSKGDKPLAIRYREDNDSYHLARYPESGHLHHNECRFYSPAPERSGMAAYAKGVVEEGADGCFLVKLAHGIRVNEESVHDGASTQPLATADSCCAQPAMSLLGLLHLLWQEARLNIWYPKMDGKRGIHTLRHTLPATAERVRISRVPLSDCLLVTAPFMRPKEGQPGTSATQHRNEQVTIGAIQRGLKLLAIAPLAKFQDRFLQTFPDLLPVAGPSGMPFLNLPAAVWARAQQQFPREIAAWGAGHTVIAMALLAPRTASGTYRQADVIDVALMRVSPRMIPVDSSHEDFIEAKLHAERRVFEKPLRYDSGASAYFPDFWLLDTPEQLPLEVFGMATPEYLERKARKTEWYNQRFGDSGWWSWDAAADPSRTCVPEFPRAKASFPKENMTAHVEDNQ